MFEFCAGVVFIPRYLNKLVNNIIVCE